VYKLPSYERKRVVHLINVTPQVRFWSCSRRALTGYKERRLSHVSVSGASVSVPSETSRLTLVISGSC